MVDVEGGVVADECVVFVGCAVVVGDGLVKGGVVNVEGDVAVKVLGVEDGGVVVDLYLLL